MTLADAVFEHIELELVGPDKFRGIVDDHGMGTVFGGQVVGQAMMAATRTVEGRACHSLQSNFLRAGDPTQPVYYEVERVRDGGSFATRRVVAIQKELAILTLSTSFHVFEEGLEHQIEMPDVPGPDDLLSEAQILEQRRVEHPDIDDQLLKLVHGERPVEIRRVQHFDYFKPRKMPPIRHSWYRSRKKLGNDRSRHQCLLAYASDTGFLGTCNMPHGESPMTGIMAASIDHSIWFHKPFNIEDWMLIAMESTITAGSRGYVRASMFSQDGTLVASAVQEGLLRYTNREVTKNLVKG